MGQIVWAGPPCTEIRFRVLSMPLPNAIHWPSAEKNGEMAPSVPRMSVGSSCPRARR